MGINGTGVQGDVHTGIGTNIFRAMPNLLPNGDNVFEVKVSIT